MERYRLDESGDRGWFIGNFDRSVFKTEACEVSYMTNFAGELHDAHYHKIATEIHLVVRGRLRVNDAIFEAGEICVIAPMEVSVSEYLEDTDSVVIKIPGHLNDKYFVD
jgi:hypothetical protein